METTFEKLRNLQDILFEKYELEKEINDIPKALATKTEVLNRAKKVFIERNDQSNQMKVKLRNLQLEMTSATQSREGYEKQMDVIKTQKEYEALEKEISDALEKEQGLRKDIQRTEKELEELQLLISKQEKQIAMDEEELKEEESDIRNQSQEKRNLLDALEKKEKTITPGMDEEILFKFERIIRSKSGLGIVGIKQGVCSGCHMILPMQYVNDVRQANSIKFCPYCSRILYWESNMDPAMQEEQEAGKLADLIDEE